jgi:dephospho-CoA kinase
LLTIGCTGGIGAGKSTVSALLARDGAVVIDADEIARRATTAGGAAVEPVLARFGAPVTAPDGSIDRAALAAIVFHDPAARRDLEAIVHPLVAAEIARRRDALPHDAVAVLDVALLVETGGRARYGLDGLLVVDAPEDLCIERLVTGRKMDPRDARARIDAQATRTERLRAADFIILNLGTLEELAAMVDRAWEWIERLAEEAGGRGARPPSGPL